MNSPSNSPHLSRYLFRDPIIVIALDTARPYNSHPMFVQGSNIVYRIILPSQPQSVPVKNQNVPLPPPVSSWHCEWKMSRLISKWQDPGIGPSTQSLPILSTDCNQGTKGKSDHRNVHLMTISTPSPPTPPPSPPPGKSHRPSYQWCLPVLLSPLMIMINTTGPLSQVEKWQNGHKPW